MGGGLQAAPPVDGLLPVLGRVQHELGLPLFELYTRESGGSGTSATVNGTACRASQRSAGGVTRHRAWRQRDGELRHEQGADRRSGDETRALPQTARQPVEAQAGDGR